jgi:hypothetical protein
MTLRVATTRTITVVLATILLAHLAPAQSTSATVSGRVFDPNSAVIIEATVSATNVGTGTTTTVQTNEQGIYDFADLEPGDYQFRVSKHGFKVIQRPGVTLHVSDTLSINFSMTVGDVSETITVQGGAPLVNTESSSVSTVIDHQFVENMPLSGRSFEGLIELVPGVVAAAATSNSPGQFSINGQRTDTNGFSIDGVSANAGVRGGGSIGSQGAGTVTNAAVTGGFNSLVSVDALQEFRLQTSTFAPEYGRTPGGQISIATRAGTNQFHGDAFDYLRNSYFDANDWFTDNQKLSTPPLRQNDFGGVLGGPVIKDKVFFFASYEGLRLSQASPTLAGTYVPSYCARGITPPASHPEWSCAATGGTPASTDIQPYFRASPLPTGSPLGPSNGDSLSMAAPFSASLPQITNLDAGSIRADYNIKSKMTLFGRYNDAPSQVVMTSSLGNLNTSLIKTKTLTVGHTWNLSSTIVNDFRFNYSTAQAAGLKSYGSSGFMGGIPVTSSTVLYPEPGDGAAQNAGEQLFFLAGPAFVGYYFGQTASNKQRQFQAVETVSYAKGAHQFKFGFDWRQLTPVFLGTPYNLRTLTLGPESELVNGTADRLEVDTEPGQTYRFYNYSVFGQDSWKIGPRLTLTYGLRWDINPAPTSPNGTYSFALSQFNPQNPTAAVMAPFGTAPYKTQWNALGPRIGVAYQLSTDPKWQRVLRGGFGLFYDTGNDVSGLLFGPYTTQRAYQSSAGFVFPLVNNDSVHNTFNCANNPPGSMSPADCLAPSQVSLTPPFFAHTQTTDPNLRLPYVYQFNVAAEQALGTSQSITATYVGAIGRNLLRTQQYGSAFPPFNSTFFFGLTVFENGGSSDYHALQLQYQKRLSHGVQALASYTWAHSIDTASTYTAGGGEGSASMNPAQDRGSSDFDIRHSVHAAVSYDLPMISKENRVARAILGYWAIDSIYQFRTAPPFDLIEGFGTVNTSTGVTVYSRPNYNGGPIWLYNGNPAAAASCGGICPGGRVLNYSSFSDPNPTGNGPNVVQGNFPRNALRAFGLQQVDLTLRRDFVLTEKVRLQFRADEFNIFNHPNFGPPSGLLSQDPVAGQSPGTLATVLSGANAGGGGFNQLYNLGGPRSMQFSLKLKF